MKMSKTLYVSSRADWRAWLAQHHETESEVWLIYYKQGSGQPRIPYDDAVEEALCFGWIDSIIQRIDDEKYAQKFTPRTNNKKWSPSNIERMRTLIAQEKVTAVGLAKFDKALLEGEPQPRVSPTTVPAFIKKGLMASPQAWENFNKLPPSHRGRYIGWISDAKREDTRQRRLAEAVERLEQNLKLEGK
jgi:uncharacterized protein YdeI (YjbR/CyaY-like superfamily)